MIVSDDGLQIIDQFGDMVEEITPVPWSSNAGVWASPFREKVVLGRQDEGIWVLTYDDGSWSIDDYAFEEGVGGELKQPYWAYDTGATIQPSDTSGSITVTASKAIWTDQHVGLRIRYGSREIEITNRISGTVVEADVVNELPPSFDVTVDDTTKFRIGEFVTGGDTQYQGLIVGISGLVLNLVTVNFFEGPDSGEEISGASGSSTISAVSTVSPYASPIWDEPLMSDLRGYPGAAGQVAGRLVLVDFPEVPDLVCLSSSREITDFEIGAEDDDAIARQVGDGAPRWLHAVNMGDLILFSDNGVYNVPARDSGVVSPSTFNPVLVDDTGCSEIKPVKVEDGIMFVDASGQRVCAALLDGNVYLKWSVRPMTTYHSHLVKSPVALCGPALRSPDAEKYMFVVNGDGTLAAISWQQSIRDEDVGFAPWETRGSFVNVSPLFGGYWAFVDREVDGSTVRFLERFSDDAYLDCAVTTEDTTDAVFLTVNGEALEVNGEQLVVSSPTASHLIGETVSYYADGWDFGDLVVESDGTVDPGFAVTGPRQIGFNFEAEMELWPVEAIESSRIGTLTARVLQLIVSVQDTLAYEVTCNGKTRKVDAYHFGDDLEAPPPLRTEVRTFSVFGNRNHPVLKVAKRRPGPFRVLATGQRVQA
jgi:hypothetical protein